MEKTGKKPRLLRSITSLMVIVIFLALGFCPLRNALCALAHPVSQNTNMKAPAYAKIIAHDDCLTAVFSQAIAFQKQLLNGNALIFAGILLMAFCACGIFREIAPHYSKITVPYPNVVPIYLKNRVLLI